MSDTEKPVPGTTCRGEVWPTGHMRPRRCTRNAKVLREGKPFCAIHDPERRRAQQEAAMVALCEKQEAEKLATATTRHRLATWDALRDALRVVVDHYVSLANSGDAGFWNPETESQVIGARAALEAADREPGT